MAGEQVRRGWSGKVTQVACPVAIQCRSVQQTPGSRCLTRRRGRGGCCAPHAPTPGWQDSAVRRWASSGTGVPLGRMAWEGGRSRSDPCPAQGTRPLGAGRADGRRQWHIGLLLRGRGKAALRPEAAGCHLRVVRRAAGRWGHTPGPHTPQGPSSSSSSSHRSQLAAPFCFSLSPSLSLSQ